MNKGVVVGCCQMWILLLEELLHQLLGSLSHYLQCFIHARWCRISVFNGTNEHVGSFFRLKDWVQKHHCKHVTQLIIWNTFVSHYWGEWSNLLNLMDLLHPGWLNHHLDVFGSVCRKIFPSYKHGISKQNHKAWSAPSLDLFVDFFCLPILVWKYRKSPFWKDCGNFE